jgi:hypothetical protein
MFMDVSKNSLVLSILIFRKIFDLAAMGFPPSDTRARMG